MLFEDFFDLFFKPKSNQDEDDFKKAKMKWAKISMNIMKLMESENINKKEYEKILPQLNEVIYLLKQASDKNHDEGTRCYAGLLMITMNIKFRLSREFNTPFVDVQMFWLQNLSEIQHIIRLLDHPRFENNVFSQVILNACLGMSLFFSKEDPFEKLKNDALFVAYAIVKGKEYNYSLSTFQETFTAKKSEVGSDHLSCLFLSFLQSEDTLNKFKAYTLEDAKQFLTKVEPL